MIDPRISQESRKYWSPRDRARGLLSYRPLDQVAIAASPRLRPAGAGIGPPVPSRMLWPR